MGTAINQPVPDRGKPLFVIFDIWALWRSAFSGRQRDDFKKCTIQIQCVSLFFTTRRSKLGKR